MEKFKGEVSEIIFLNEENGYAVLEFDAGSEYFTAVGVFPLISVGEMLEITGEFRNNGKFGEQFVVSEAQYARPDDMIGTIRFLSGGLFKGIGEKLARQIVEVFGEKTLDILDEDPSQLIKVPGIGRKKLAEIIEGYREARNMKEALIFLQQYDVSVGLAMKIYRFYGDSTESVVKNNPYRLTIDIAGVGFLTADKIAKKMGIEKDSPFRIQAGITYALNDSSAKNGHTCLPENVLLEMASKALELPISVVKQTLDDTLSVKKFVTEAGTMVAPELNYRTENSIATKLLLLNGGADKWDMDPEKELENWEKGELIKFHERQKEAIRSVFYNGVTVITGGPGTGKTTIIRAICGIAEQRGKNIILCAPTGRASKRMSELTGMESRTIHRLLGVDFSNKDGGFGKNEQNPIVADIIIVDEISMADIFIFCSLLKAIPRGARLVLVGDKDQLPSVSCGNILSDIIKSGNIPVTELTEIYRQEGDSYIVINAHRINRGQMPLYDNRKDFFVNTKNSPEGIVNTVIGMIKSRIPNFAHVDSSDIQVLTPLKKGVVGVENLNLEIREALNPETKKYIHKDMEFRLHDKVMQTSNDYTIEWTRREDGEHGAGVYNGDMGFVTAIRDDGIEVLFDDGKMVYYRDGELDELTLAYCVSVHKSQGSEFPVAIIALCGANYMIMTRNLLYTAVTRAKKMVVIVGEEGAIKRMIANDYTAQRYSLLKDLLIKNKDKVDLLWGD